LKFLDSSPGKQVITGRRRRIGNDFRHRRGSRANEGRNVYSRYVLFKAAAWRPAWITGKEHRDEPSPCPADPTAGTARRSRSRPSGPRGYSRHAGLLRGKDGQWGVSFIKVFATWSKPAIAD
jgi:hypothetical protein